MKFRTVLLGLGIVSLALLVAFPVRALNPDDAFIMWLFEEGSGGTVKDSSGNGNDATINGDAKWVNGKIGGGLQLDQNISLSAPANGVEATAISETLWVKFDDFSTENQFGYIRATGTANARYFYFSTWNSAGAPHNAIHLGAIKPDGSWGRSIATDPVFKKDQWYFIAGVVDTAEGKIRAYVDGQLHTEQDIPTGDIPGTPEEVWVGGTSENYQWLKGTIDEVSFWKVALTEADINDIMTKGLMGAAPVEPTGKLAITWATLKR